MCLISSSSFETRSTPALLGATRRAFAFSLGNPISSVPDFLNSKYLSERRVLRSEIEDRFGAAAATDAKRRPRLSNMVAAAAVPQPLPNLSYPCHSRLDVCAYPRNTRGADALCELEVE